MATFTFVLIETELSDAAGNKVAGPVTGISGPFSAALKQSLTGYWTAASGGRADVQWAPDMYQQVTQTRKQWEDLALRDRINQVRAQAGVPDGTNAIVVANDALDPLGATPQGSSPYLHAEWLSQAGVAHEMGHFFQWAGTTRTGHADVARDFFRDEYGDPTCIMGGEDNKLSFNDYSIPQLPLHPSSRQSGPLMNPAMADLCGWLDPALPGILSVDPVSLGTVTLQPWTGAPPENAEPHARTLAIIDGFAADGARVYVCLRGRRGWDRGFGSFVQPMLGEPVPMLCVYLATSSGDSLLLTRQPAVPGAVFPAGQIPLQVAVVGSNPEGVTLELRRSSWRGSFEIQGVACDPAAQVAGAAWGSTADLYVIDTAGQVRYNHYNGHGWEHKPWPVISGVTCDPLGGIAAVARHEGLVEVFVTDLAGTVHRRKRMDWSWSASWEPIAGGGFDARSPLAAARLDDDTALLCGARPDHQVWRTLVSDAGPVGNWESAPPFDAGRVAATPADGFRGRVYAVNRTNRDRSIWATPDVASPDPESWGVVGQILFDDTARPVAATMVVSGPDVVLAGTDPLTSLQWNGVDWPAEPAQPVDRIHAGGIAVFSREEESFDAVYIDRNGAVQVMPWSPRADYQPPNRQYEAESTVILFAYDGAHLVRAKSGGGDGMGADGEVVGEWERLRMLELGSYVINAGERRRIVAFQAHNGQYIGAVGGGGSHVVATATQVGPWEHFYLHELPGQPLKVTVGCIDERHFWTANGGGGAALGADKAWEKEWETFTLITTGTP